MPSMAEAFDRLHHLRDHGPTAHAFDFKSARDFPRPGADSDDTPVHV